MGKSSPSAPAAPDPTATAQAQTASNKETALYSFGLNNPNYNTPLGSLTYTRTDPGPTYNNDAYQKALDAWTTAKASPGSGKVNIGTLNRPIWADGPSGSNQAGAMPQLSDFKIEGGNPQYTADIRLSPEQQKLYDQNTSQSIDLSKLAGMLQGRVGDTLNQPLPTSGDFNTAAKNAQDAYYKNQTQYLDPQFAQGQEQLDAKLANQGITMGSEAYNNDQNNFARQKQSAYDTAQNNAILQGPQNAQQLFALSSAARSQPLNEFNALRSQSQVSMPSFNPTQPSSMAPTNTAQIAQNAYLGQQNAYNQQVAGNNSMTSGLFNLGGSLGAAAIPAIFSDIRLKENIKYIGQEKGHNIYTFNYIKDPEKIPYRGVMAQEIFDYMPEAIAWDGEYLMVNYNKLGIEFGRIH